ncbi:Nicotinamidase-related amidase [bacterium A37T11]|nr:Nicotinamidase-related amidase [bacterium A37T11]
MDYTTINWKRSALVIIDMQHDFVSLQGAATIEGTEAILPELIRLVDCFRSYGLPVIHVIRLYQADGSNADNCRRGRIESGFKIACTNTEGAYIIPSLLPEGSQQPDHKKLLSGQVVSSGKSDYMLYKPRWGAFYKTALHELLGQLNVDSILIAGCNFPNCPRTSIYEASERDFRIGIVKGTISGMYDRGLNELTNIGVNIYTREEIEALLFS